MNPEFRDRSPGLALFGYVIHWAIEHGYETIDFLRGDELYKRNLGAKLQPLWHVSLKRGM
jgi:CelD/BcsL family acetyltransferase involved in cellulose biosynthesis